MTSSWGALRRNLALPVLLLATWQLSTHFGWANPQFLAPITKVLSAPFEPVIAQALVRGFLSSMYRVIEGGILGTLLGLALGVAFGLSNRCVRLLEPSFHCLRQIALFAWIPLISAWLGNGEASKILIIALAAFFPVVMNTARGIRAVPIRYLEVAQALCLSRRRRLIKVILPAAAPSILTGVQLALIYVWVATIGAEYLIGPCDGLGSVLLESRLQFRMDIVMVGMAIIGVIGFLINALFLWLSRRFFGLKPVAP